MPPILLIHKNDHVPNDPLLVLSQQTSNEKLSAPPCRHDEPSHLKIRQPTSTNFRTIATSVPRTKCTALRIRDDLSSPSSSHPSSIPTVSAREKRQILISRGASSTNPDVGIIIGCITGLLLVIGIFYVWYLRIRPRKKSKKKKNGKKKVNGEKKKVKKAKKKGLKKRLRRSLRRRMRRSIRGKRRRSSAVSIISL